MFIGHSLKHKVVQEMLDECLLDDEEMKMGPEEWEESWAAEDQIQLSLDEDYYSPFAAALSQDEENGKEAEGGSPPNKRSKRYRDGLSCASVISCFVASQTIHRTACRGAIQLQFRENHSQKCN